MASVIEAPIFEMWAAFRRGPRGALYLHSATIRNTRREARLTYIGPPSAVQHVFERHIADGEVEIRKVDVTLSEY